MPAEYVDERGYLVTESEVKATYDNLIQTGEIDIDITFKAYLADCCGKNGTLEKRTI